MVVAVSFVLVPDTSAEAVVVGLYELDGDVVNDSAVAGDDAVNVRSGTSGALATTVVSDPVNTGTDVMFSSGGGACSVMKRLISWPARSPISP